MALKAINAILKSLPIVGGWTACRSRQSCSRRNRASRVSVLLRLTVGLVMGNSTSSAMAQADLATTNRLSLADAKQIAFERNWDLLAAKRGMDAPQGQLLCTKKFPNPIASLSTVKIGDREASTVLGNGLIDRNYDSIAAVSQLIEIGGKRHDRQIAARAGVEGARARFFDAQRSLEQGVTKAYIAALLADENARILNESARLLRHEADIAQARLKA